MPIEESLATYAQHLQTIGLDLASLHVDSDGTIMPQFDDSIESLSLNDLPYLAIEADGAQLDSPALRMGQTIGQGGMGVVKSAQQIALQRRVAVKLVRADKDEAKTRMELLREAWITGRVAHPNVVPIYSLGRGDHGQPIFVMKEIEGVPWTHVLHNPKVKGAPERAAKDPLGFHLDVLMSVCDAVHFAHSRSILHRDLKPDNIMIGAFGEVYVLDWGIAVAIEEIPGMQLPRAENIRSVSGTPAYMAPEMASAEGPQIGPRSDVFLLGAILHEIVTGRHRHGGTTVQEMLVNAYHCEAASFDDSVPLELQELVNRATAKNPERRPVTAESFRLAIALFLEHRVSVQLNVEARERWARLEPMLDDKGADPTEINALSVEARFGYKHALVAWAGNTEARQGLERVLGRMAEYEISRDNRDAAAALIAQLPDQASLAHRLEDLDKRIAAKSGDSQALEDLRRERDLGVGAIPRALFGVMLGLATLISSFAAVWLDGNGYITLNHIFLVKGFLAFFFVDLVASLILWKHFDNNLASRQQNYSLILAFALNTLMFLGAWKMGVPFEAALAIASFMGALIVYMLALLLHVRFKYAGMAYLATAAAIVFFPGYAMQLFGTGNFVAFCILAAFWSHRAMEN